MREQETSELLHRAAIYLSRIPVEMMHRLGLWQHKDPIGVVSPHDQ